MTARPEMPSFGRLRAETRTNGFVIPAEEKERTVFDAVLAAEKAEKRAEDVDLRVVDLTKLVRRLGWCLFTLALLFAIAVLAWFVAFPPWA